MPLIEILGYLGAILLAVCGVPQLLKCWKDKHADGLSWGLIILWLTGEIVTIAYLFLAGIMTAPLALNYGCNVLIVMAILYYKIWNRKK